MSLCKVCFNQEINTLNDLLFTPPICVKCLAKFKTLFLKEKNKGIEYLFLYNYEGIIKELIYSFKGLYRKDLACVFTYQYKNFLRSKYRGYTFLCAPSMQSDDLKRGYNHVEEIAKSISKKVLKPFYKCKEWKQSDKSYSQRKNIKDIIKVNSEMIKGLKKVVIIDDIFSTGSTIESFIQHIDTNCDIKVLCICRNLSKNV